MNALSGYQKMDIDKAKLMLEQRRQQISLLQAKQISEIKALKSPPEGVKMIASALMIIDNRPTEWAEFLKATKSVKTWVQSLTMYNKDNDDARLVIDL